MVLKKAAGKLMIGSAVAAKDRTQSVKIMATKFFMAVIDVFVARRRIYTPYCIVGLMTEMVS